MISNHYLHAVLNEVDDLVQRKIYPKSRIERWLVDSYDKDAYLIPVRVGRSLYLIHHYMNPKWSKERNAWEISKKVHTKRKEDRYW